jgi:hypothetical protein
MIRNDASPVEFYLNEREVSAGRGQGMLGFDAIPGTFIEPALLP